MSLDQLGAAGVTALVSSAFWLLYYSYRNDKQEDTYEERIRIISEIDARLLKDEQREVSLAWSNIVALEHALRQSNVRNAVLETEKNSFIAQIDEHIHQYGNLKADYASELERADNYSKRIDEVFTENENLLDRMADKNRDLIKSHDAILEIEATVASLETKLAKATKKPTAKKAVKSVKKAPKVPEVKL